METSSSAVGSPQSSTHPYPSPASSPPAEKPDTMPNDIVDEEFLTTEELAERKEEQKAMVENNREETEAKRRAALERKKKRLEKKISDEEERKQRDEALDKILKGCKVFSDFMVGKTEVLGRVGVSHDGKSLEENDNKSAENHESRMPQPTLMVNGTMRDYQLQGLRWMWDIVCQGMSGILADEMGLGKCIAAILLCVKLIKTTTQAKQSKSSL
jgi:ATP-dependent DNA helicase